MPRSRSWNGLLLLAFLPSAAPCEPQEGFAQGEFEILMQGLADAWNAGDARRGADCFTEDAVYSDPPDVLLFQGRETLFEFFGGEEGRPRPMEMVWHHLAYDPGTGIGFGEFTFTYGSISHGVAVVRIRDGLIANWREYYTETELAWEEFTAANPF